jgi:hypothetical protein
MLLEAFRERAQEPATVRPIAGRATWRSRTWPRMAWTAAAVILIIFGFVVYRSTQNKPRKDEVLTVVKPTTPSPSVTHEGKVEQNVGNLQPRRKTYAPQQRRENRPKPNLPFIRDSITAYGSDSEYVSDFYPLNQGDDQAPMESGELIRVQMPRSALVKFGLPVNVVSADVPVKADLLVGEDGLARAIRFVR